MKNALVTDPSAPWPLRWTSSHAWPFFIAISAATMQHSSRATWIGPSSASSPKRASEPPMRATSVARGTSASRSEGSLGASVSSGAFS